MEFTLLWAALTAVAFAWIGLRVWNERLPEHASDRLVAATLAGLFGGRLVAMIAQGVNPITHPLDIIMLRGGVNTVAASGIFLLALIWMTRATSVAPDALAPTILAALAGWHAGCLWRGACLGSASDLPWAWSQSGSLVTRHPVEIYAAIGLIAGAYLVSRLGWRLWLRTGSAVIVASGLRLATEPLRPSLTSGAVPWYFVGVGVGLLMIVVGPHVGREKESVDIS